MPSVLAATASAASPSFEIARHFRIVYADSAIDCSFRNPVKRPRLAEENVIPSDFDR